MFHEGAKFGNKPYASVFASRKSGDTTVYDRAPKQLTTPYQSEQADKEKQLRDGIAEMTDLLTIARRVSMFYVPMGSSQGANSAQPVVLAACTGSVFRSIAGGSDDGGSDAGGSDAGGSDAGDDDDASKFDDDDASIFDDDDDDASIFDDIDDSSIYNVENMRKKVEGLVQIFKEEAVSESRMTDINKYVSLIILARKTNDFENELIDFPEKDEEATQSIKKLQAILAEGYRRINEVDALLISP